MGRGCGGRSSGGGFRGAGAGHRYYDYSTQKAAVCATYGAPRSDYVPSYKEWMSQDPNFKEWYNRVSPKERWERSIPRAIERCSENPNGTLCLQYMELLVDCPPEKLEGLNLPPPGVRTESVLDFPLELKDPLSACKMWKTMLKVCRKYNTHYNSQWKCVPYEGFVHDDCPSDKRGD